MSRVTCVDLLHMGVEGCIACYLVEAEEPTIVDPGPSTTLDHLVQELAGLGIGPNDLRHIVLTHVHLDHAGAAGHLVGIFPKATVHVHEDGASHMVEPERLVASTRRTFGDAHDRLWGEVKPVPSDRINRLGPNSSGPWRGLCPVASPGHINHHLAYLEEQEGTLFSGDSMGAVLSGAPPIPTAPPPAVDLRAWTCTLREIGEIGPERLAATHFGFRSDVEFCRTELAGRLEALERRVRDALASGDESGGSEYEREVREEVAACVGEDRVSRYFDTFPPSIDWAGVAFYVNRHPRGSP